MGPKRASKDVAEIHEGIDAVQRAGIDINRCYCLSLGTGKYTLSRPSLVTPILYEFMRRR